MRNVLLFVMLFFSIGSISAQEESNVRTKTIATSQDTILLDSNTVSPGTLFVEGVDSNAYYMDYAHSKFIWIDPPTTDSISITYRVWPININASAAHKSTQVFTPDKTGKVDPFKYQGNTPNYAQFATGKLDKSGSISRGMLFGNNQNLGINSNLNLQLSGELSNNIKIKAVISDNNIPVQPDGNTQLLQDFDQVYIQLYNDKWKLIAGDYRISKPVSHFMAFDKRLRGGSITTKFKSGSKTEHNLSVNAALSRGKFSRNVLQGVEGNQGPYRLNGAENEAFIVILSGTEVVYIDGVQLTRGQQHDYVIDYNNAEIIFTAKQPITKDKRIVVEFQYSAQAYGRSLIQVSDNIQMKRMKLNFNIYAEQDNKNAPLLQDLTNENKQLLESVGDNVNDAVVIAEREIEFSNDRVLYKKKIDSVSMDSIYVYSTNPDSARYQLSFSNLGQGNADYIEISSNANGRVFEYVRPINGIRQGTYSPVVLLITPKRKHMYTVGGEYILSGKSKLLFEGVVTNNDVNTFSSDGNQNDIGGGFLVGWSNLKKVSSDTARPWFMDTKVAYENRSDNFGEIQRYRSVEFDRNWNVRGDTLTGQQHVPLAQLNFSKKGLGKLGYEFKSFISGESYQGFRNQLTSDLDNTSFTAKFTGSLLNSKGSLGETQFNRHKALFQKKYEHFKIGFRDDFEHNLKRNNGFDSLSVESYSFFEWEVFIANGDSTKNKFKIGYIQRSNDEVKNNKLTRSTLGKSVLGQLALIKNPRATLQLSSQYRVLEVTDSTLYDGAPDQNLTNRVDYTFRLLKGALNLSSFYEIGSGLAEEQAYVYVEVPAGTGVYTWNDYNENGIAEQDEFEIAQFQDQANYIRVLTQTNNFEKIYRTQFNQTLFLNPAVVWRNKKGVRNVLSKFSNQFAYRIDRKTDNNSLEAWIDPFTSLIADSNIRTLNSSLRNTLFLNRSNKLWSIDYTYQEANTKTLQSNGLLGNSDIYHQVNFRYNLSKVYQLNIEAKTGDRASGAEYTSNRNYQIAYSGFKPTLTYMQGSGVKIKLFFEQIEKRNAADLGGEFNRSKNFGAELNVRKVGKGSLIIMGNYLINEYEGNINSAVSYQILEGLQPGKNALWEVTYQRNIAKYLQLSLRYNGRSSEENPIVHTGSVQVRAFF